MKYIYLIPMVLWAANAFSQVTIHRGDSLPHHAQLHDWYSRSYNTECQIWDGEKWVSLGPQGRGTAREWKGFVEVKQGDMKSYFYPDARPLLLNTHWMVAKDSVYFAYVCGKGTYALYYKGDTLAHSPYANHNLGQQIIEVEGESYFCMPAYERGTTYSREFPLRNWGLLNTHGEWVLPPQFDAPFEPKEGKISVLFKGAQQTWDLRGNRLD